MENRVLLVTGSAADRGRAHGEILRSAARHNISGFWSQVDALGYDRKSIRKSAERYEQLMPVSRLEEIEGLARGVGMEYPEVLGYNALNHVINPDECTVFMAVGKASATGDTVFCKNSDKVGGSTLVGPNFFRFKEVNVLAAVKAEAGHMMIGVAAAGNTGLKMACSSLGIAAGTNIARTEAMYQKALDLTQIRAIDRAQLIRDGLEKTTALAACQDTMAKMISNPTATPGNVEYADAKTAYILEGSYTEVGQQTVRDDVAGRSNMFILLKALNAWNDTSSQARYIRLMEFLTAKKGSLTTADLIALSGDHENGPGPNSICRHGNAPEEEVSLAAMVVGINGAEPAKTTVSFALGKPCHAWNHADGHIDLRMDFKVGDLPNSFTNGDVWKKYYEEVPYAG